MLIKPGSGLFILLLYLCLLLTGFGDAQDLPGFFSAEDIAVLERLVLLAQQHDLASLTEIANLKSLEIGFGLEGRLAKALSISGSASLSGDIYGQAIPSYSISVSLDVMKLLNSEGSLELGEQKLREIRQEKRLKVVEAFVGYKVALLAAETAARALEASEARFKVSSERVKVGESILSEQIAAQSEVARAGLALYSANAEVIVALETLAGEVGVSVTELAGLLEFRDD
jgi:hypothetical protein